MINKHSLINILIVAAILICCFATRLPQLLSSNLLLDPDECVSGLMAKHLYEGKDVSIFFYGQKYGFSLIEISMISVAYFFMGISDHAVKIAMLVLWSLGIVFFYKTVKTIKTDNSLLPLLITLLFIVSPAWAVWSMKARGGYLTAFFFSNLCTYLLFNKELSKKKWPYFAIGIILVIIYASQPLWLPGLIPLVVYKLYAEEKQKNILSVLAGVIPLLIAFLVLQSFTVQTVYTPDVFDLSYPLFSPSFIFEHLAGYYNAWGTPQQPAACIVFAWCMCGVCVTVVLFALYFLYRSPKEHGLFIISVLCMLLTLAYTIFLRTPSQRYLLPFTGNVLLSLFLLFDTAKKRSVIYVGLAAFIILGGVCMMSFYNYKISPLKKKDFISSVEYLKKNKAYYVYSAEWYLGWQVMFYSNEMIVARHISDQNRYPAYVKAVDSAYSAAKCNAAIISLELEEPVARSKNGFYNSGKGFLVSLCPEKEQLLSMGVKFSE